MARINSAIYNKQSESVDAFEVDDHLGRYDNHRFTCIFCGVKIQFNRGINQSDPHFKNWPNMSHSSTCKLLEIYAQIQTETNSGSVESMISTILPRAKELRLPTDENLKRRRIQKLYSKRSKKFLNALATISPREMQTLRVLTEDGAYVFLKDLIKTQDEIILELNRGSEFICVLKGATGKAQPVASSFKLPLTVGSKHGNTQKFELFIPASFVEKNRGDIESMENALILCYGVPVKNNFGCKMDLYSITHQVSVIKKFTPELVKVN